MLPTVVPVRFAMARKESPRYPSSTRMFFASSNILAAVLLPLSVKRRMEEGTILVADLPVTICSARLSTVHDARSVGRSPRIVCDSHIGRPTAGEETIPGRDAVAAVLHDRCARCLIFIQAKPGFAQTSRRFGTVVLLRAMVRLRIIILMMICADECEPVCEHSQLLKSAALDMGTNESSARRRHLSLCSRIGSAIRTAGRATVPAGCASSLGQCTGDLNDPTRWRSLRARRMPPRLSRYVCVHL